MDLSLEAALAEILRKFDELDARSERRWATLLDRRGAAARPRVGGIESPGATELIVADNWGGLFDEIPAVAYTPVRAPDSTDTASSDSSSSPSGKEQLALDAHIVADNWAGMFELAPILEERVLDPSATVVVSFDSAPDSDPIPDDAAAMEEIESVDLPLQIQEREELEMEVGEKILPSTGSEELTVAVSALASDSLAQRARSFLMDGIPALLPPRLHQQRRAPPRSPPLRRLWRRRPPLRHRSPPLRRLWRRRPPLRHPQRPPPRPPRLRRPKRAPPRRWGRPRRPLVRGHHPRFRARARPRMRPLQGAPRGRIRRRHLRLRSFPRHRLRRRQGRLPGARPGLGHNASEVRDPNPVPTPSRPSCAILGTIPRVYFAAAEPSVFLAASLHISVGSLLFVGAEVRSLVASTAPRTSSARCSTLGRSHDAHVVVATGGKPSVNKFCINISDVDPAVALARFTGLVRPNADAIGLFAIDAAQLAALVDLKSFILSDLAELVAMVTGGKPSAHHYCIDVTDAVFTELVVAGESAGCIFPEYKCGKMFRDKRVIGGGCRNSSLGTCVLQTMVSGVLLSSEEGGMVSVDLHCYKAPMAILLLVPATLAMERKAFEEGANLALEEPSFHCILLCISCLADWTPTKCSMQVLDGDSSLFCVESCGSEHRAHGGPIIVIMQFKIDLTKLPHESQLFHTEQFLVANANAAGAGREQQPHRHIVFVSLCVRLVVLGRVLKTELPGMVKAVAAVPWLTHTVSACTEAKQHMNANSSLHVASAILLHVKMSQHPYSSKVQFSNRSELNSLYHYLLHLVCFNVTCGKILCVPSYTPSGSVVARLYLHLELSMDLGGGVAVPVFCIMLLGALVRQWLAWTEFQKLVDGMEVRTIKNMITAAA